MNFNPQFVIIAPAWKAPCDIWKLHVLASINWHKLFSFCCFGKTVAHFTLTFEPSIDTWTILVTSKPSAYDSKICNMPLLVECPIALLVQNFV